MSNKQSKINNLKISKMIILTLSKSKNFKINIIKINIKEIIKIKITKIIKIYIKDIIPEDEWFSVF